MPDVAQEMNTDNQPGTLSEATQNNVTQEESVLQDVVVVDASDEEFFRKMSHNTVKSQ